MKNGAPQDELKTGRGRGWAVPYSTEEALRHRFNEESNLESTSNWFSQRFQKGVGSQRGLAQGNPSHTVDSDLFVCTLSPMPPL